MQHRFLRVRDLPPNQFVLAQRLFTEDPVALRAQWLAVVKAIISVRAKLAQAGVAGA